MKQLNLLDHAEPLTRIFSNGGGRMLPVEALFSRLETDVLDPAFEEYGNFIDVEPERLSGQPYPAGTVSFFGNFATYSHVFQIETRDPTLIERLSALIRANQARPEYANTKAEFAEQKRRHLEWIAARDAKRREEQQHRARQILEAAE